jgi:hypothetical protein
MVLQWPSCMIHGVEPDLLGALFCACNHDQILYQEFRTGTVPTVLPNNPTSEVRTMWWFRNDVFYIRIQPF